VSAGRRRFLRWLLIFALVHYGVLLLVRLIEQLATGVPPKLVAVDGFILVLTRVEQVLVAVRSALRAAWPAETVPASIGVLFTILNSLAWGAVLAVLKKR